MKYELECRFGYKNINYILSEYCLIRDLSFYKIVRNKY